MSTGSNMKAQWLAVWLMIGGAASAMAADWHTVAEITASAKTEASEIGVGRDVREIQIECREGAVVINTLWVRGGGGKREIRVARLFNKGEKQQFDLGGSQTVASFRISNRGPGVFRVLVK